MKRRIQAFTLVEILVVLGIIMLLAAILFPIFNRARERSYQTHCASNLKQIYFAVSQYHADHKRYPGSLAFVVSDSMKLANYNPTPGPEPTPVPTPTPVANPKGLGYFKGDLESLRCSDDDSEVEHPYSSYGDLSNGIEYGPAGVAKPEPPGRYVWNQWGYDEFGWAHITPPLTLSDYRLSNRYAPSSTIITHCVFHRMPTARDLASPAELYADADDSRDARDIVLRLDGSAKLLDVTTWKDPDPTKNKWIVQTR